MRKETKRQTFQILPSVVVDVQHTRDDDGVMRTTCEVVVIRFPEGNNVRIPTHVPFKVSVRKTENLLDQSVKVTSKDAKKIVDDMVKSMVAKFDKK